MKQKFIIILLFSILIGCQNNKEQEIIKEILKEYKSHSSFSYKIKKTIYYSKIKEDTCSIIVNNKTNTFVFLDNNRAYYKVDRKGITFIDNNNEEFSEFKKRSIVYSNFFEALKMQIEDFNLYTPYYTLKENIKTNDTIINSENYKILSYKEQELLVSKDKNSALERYITYIYYNKKNKLIDKIEYILEDSLNNYISAKRIKYEFFDFSFEDKSNEIDSLFNYNNIRYSIFSRHDENNVPFSFLYTEEKDTTMNQKLMTYPIVDLNGDTTTIKEQKGWVLLDFWFFGCVSCKDFFETLKIEKEKNKHTFLSKNNIKLMSINPLSTDKDKLRKEVQEFGMEQYIYYSKGINEYLYMKIMPIYYLVSPDKKILYHSRNIKDYSEIKKIIENYNKNNSYSAEL